MMRLGTMYRQGDILLIPVPFTDLSTKKQRPVLVVSNNYYNKSSDDLLVAAITSQIKELDYAVVIESIDLIEGDLVRSSLVRADKLYTLSKKIVKRKFGSVRRTVVKEVVENINYFVMVTESYFTNPNPKSIKFLTKPMEEKDRRLKRGKYAEDLNHDYGDFNEDKQDK